MVQSPRPTALGGSFLRSAPVASTSGHVRSAAALAVLGALLLAGCAKKRETPPAPAPAVVKPASSVACGFESATASAKLEVDILSLDIPGSDVRRVLTCAHRALVECAGTLGDGAPKLAPTEIGAVVQVEGHGLVTSVQTRPTKGAAPSPALTSCVEAILRRTTFPAPEKASAELRLGFSYEPRPFEELEKLPRFAGATANLVALDTIEGAMTGLPAASEGIVRRARGCYLLALEGADATKGAIAFDVVVSPAGVDNVKMTPAGTMDKGLISCVDTVLRNTAWEKPKRKAVVRGKLVFERAPP
jgi:hypothetical protein